MLTIEVGNVWSTIDGYIGPNLEDQIDKATNFKVPNAFFAWKFQRGKWDGRMHLFEAKKQRFPTGLLPRVIAVGKDIYQVRDVRRFPKPQGQVNLPGIELRQYQKSTVASMVKLRNGVVRIPTGGGKTFIAAAAIKAFGIPTGYIVHTRSLMSQVRDEFEKIGMKVACIGGGHYQDDPTADVTIFMVQTLMSLIKRKHLGVSLERYQMLMIDECHHVASDGSKASWYIASEKFINAPLRYGLSATPVMDGHGMLLEAATGPLIKSVDVSTLQSEGFIAKSRIKFVKLPEQGQLPIGLTQQEVYVAGICRNRLRNEIVRNKALHFARKGQMVMIFVERIAHGLSIRDLFLDMMKTVDVPAFRFLSGEHSREEIEFVKEAAKTRELKILIVTRKLFGEGVDIPAVDVLINAAGGKSAIVFIQMFGRGLRPAEGKDALMYLDFIDNAHRYLKNHSRARMRHCEQLRQSVEVVEHEEPERSVPGELRISI